MATATATIKELPPAVITTPLTITTVALWLDAADTSTLSYSSGSNISQWNDKSGNGYHATQPSVGAQPTYSSALSSVVLDGSTQYFNINLDFLASQDHESFIVLKNYNYTNIYGALTGGSGANSLHIGFSATNAYRMNFWGNDYYPNISAAYISGGRNIVSFDWLSSTSTKAARANGTLEGSINQYGLIGTMSGGGTIGNVVSQGYLQAEICEVVIILNANINQTNRQKMEGYLAWKWGIQSQLPAGHPYKTTNPNTPGGTFTAPYIPTLPIRNKNTSMFSPTQVSGCALWLDGTDPLATGTIPQAGVTLTAWRDKSGNAYHSVATGTPTQVSGGGVNFNGSSYFLNQTFVQNLSQRSIFIVMQETTRNSVYGVFPLIPTPNTGNDYTTTTGLSIETSGGLYFYGNNGAYQDVLGNPTLLVKAVYNDNMNVRAGTGYLNGLLQNSPTASYTAGSCSGYGVGARWLGSSSMSYGLNGIIYEILYYNTILTTSQRQQIEGYLSQKWGVNASLPNGHPYKRTSLNLQISYQYSAQSASNWRPTSYSGCSLWLDATDATTIVLSGSAVSQWTDKTGNTNVLQGSGSLRPTYLPTSFNGKPTLMFSDPSNSTYTALTSGSTNLYNSVSALMYFAVVRVISPAASYPSPISIQNKATFYLNGLNNSGGFTGTNIWTYQGSAFVASQNTSFPYDTYALFCLSLGSLQQFFLNGGETISSPAFTFGTGTNLTVNIGYSGYNANDGFNGYISEVIIYTTLLTKSQRQQVEGYLAWKWGLQGNLPAAHPYKNFPPPPQ